MEYWKIGGTENGYGPDGLLLIDGESDMVLSLKKEEGGKIRFLEECDGYFQVTMEKEKAVAALQEAIAWILDT